MVLDWSVSDGNTGAQGSGGAKTATGQTTVRITAVDDAPVVTASSGSVTGGAQAVAVDAGLSLSDADSATLSQATVSITGGFFSGQDVLAFTNADAVTFGNIAGSYNTATGVLSLTSSGASATVAQFQAALRAVTYQNTATTPTVGTRTLSIMADDGATASNAATRSVAVMAANRAPSFVAGTGKVVTPMSSGYAEAKSVVAQADGKIVLGGHAYNGTDFDFALTRYNADGSLDTSFGSGGKVVMPVGSSTDYGRNVAVLSDGKILLGGYAISAAGNLDFAVTRYTSNGSLDTSFGSGGKVVTPVGAGADYGLSMTVQSDGKIVLGGYGDGGATGNDFALVRYNADGSLDTTFNGSGKVLTPVGRGADFGQSVAVQADGRILLAGVTYGSGGSDFALVRYTGNGSLDTSFGTGGKVVTSVAPSYDSALSVVVQASGKILLGGYTQNASYSNDFALARYNADGSLDASFGTGGKVVTPVGSGSAIGVSLALQDDGKVLLGGLAANGANGDDFALVRYTADGALDTSFGAGTGKVVFPIGPGGASDQILAVTVQSDGRILLSGSGGNGSSSDFALVRLNADGSFDTSFGLADTIGGSVAYTENASPVVLDADVTLSDADLTTIGAMLGQLSPSPARAAPMPTTASAPRPAALCPRSPRGRGSPMPAT